MSVPAPTLTASAGVSKAAKKKSKKGKAPAEAPPSTLPPSALGGGGGEDQAHYGHHHPHPAPLDSLDPDAYADPNFFPPGSYPIDLQYDPDAYYDDVSVAPPEQGSLNLPFTFDYPLNFSASNGNHLGQVNISHEDLVQAANELYRRMADPDFGNDDLYWSTLPPHIRQFVRDAVPLQGRDGRANGDVIGGAKGAQQGQQRELYSMAQRIVSAASQGMGLGAGLGANFMSGVANVSVNGNGRTAYPQPSMAEELGFHRHPDARTDEYDDEDDFEADEQDVAAANGDGPKKKNKKKKKKGAAVLEPPPAALPPRAVKLPPRLPPPTGPIPPTPQPALNPPPPPVTPAPPAANPPPSSRAAGKQPMANPPAPAANPPARSARAAGKAPASAPAQHNHHNHTHPAPAKPAPAAKGKAPATTPPAKVWQQMPPDARAKIQQFWLELSEQQRRDLLSAEVKETMQKMRDQQRNSCGCAVCGRKKVTIEHELHALYTAWYTEMETKVEHQRAAAKGQKPQPAGAGPFPGSVEVDSTGQITKLDHRAPDPKLHPADAGEESDEYEDDEEYDDEEDLDDEEINSDEAEAGDDLDEPVPPPPSARPTRKLPSKAAPARTDGGKGGTAGVDDFQAFGSNFASIKGGVLTVADDLLKNDSSKFVEMMEQLSLCRVQREEQNIRDLQADTDEELDNGVDEPLTEAERMEEGMRMFQIFAARMFEKRVYDAYLERQSQRHQEDLLAALLDEENSKKAREEKKAKEAQRKKDKKKMQKQKADEEKAARDAEAAQAAESARMQREAEERERQRKAEEEKARREAVKRAAQEEAQRQAAEKKKRQQEEREREEDAARKKKEREDRAKREREQREREAKERERKEKEERLAAEKAERERIAKEKAEKERIAQEEAEKARIKEQERLAELEAARKAEAAKREQEAKAAAALKAQQDRERAEKEALERAAAAKLAQEKAAAAAAAQAALAAVSARPGSHTARNGPTPQPPPPSPPPALHGSPIKPTPIRPPSSVRPPSKGPGAYFQSAPQPINQAYPSARMAGPPALASGYRPPYPTQSPFQSAPIGSSSQSGPPGLGALGGASSSMSPHMHQPNNFDLRNAPIGIGFPIAKPPTRAPSTDEQFSPPTAPIGQAPRSISLGTLDPDPVEELDFRRPDHLRTSVGAIGTIGRPAFGQPEPLLPIGSTQQTHDSPLTNHANHLGGSSSPKLPAQTLGSAALGSGDDEIVTRSSRRVSTKPAPGLPGPPGLSSAAPGSAAGAPWDSSPLGHAGPPASIGSLPSVGSLGSISSAPTRGWGPPPGLGPGQIGSSALGGSAPGGGRWGAVPPGGAADSLWGSPLGVPQAGSVRQPSIGGGLGGAFGAPGAFGRDIFSQPPGQQQQH